MTHSLHRFGPEESLEKDFVVMTMASRGVTEKGSGPKIVKHLTICKAHNPVNMGGLKIGNTCNFTPDEVLSHAGADLVSTFNGVFTDRETTKKVLKEIVDQKIGLSVVVSGLYAETEAIAKELGIKPHTVNHSLGIWGKKELLPEPEILEITTLCGHGMISQHLVRFYFDKVKKGYDADKAAKEIGKFCYCAICNVARIADVLRRGLPQRKEA
jgi:hypothetical protein